MNLMHSVRRAGPERAGESPWVRHIAWNEMKDDRVSRREGGIEEGCISFPVPSTSSASWLHEVSSFIAS